MADIVCSTECASGMTMNAFPNDCTQTDFGFPKLIIVAPASTTDGVIATSGSDVPTVSDFQSAITAGSCVVIADVSNGQKLAGEQQTISDADTYDNLPEVISEREGIQGNLKRINDDTLNDLEKLNCHKRAKLWYVTNKGYCFGNQNGYHASLYFSDWQHDGFGNRSMIPFTFMWMRPSKTSGIIQDDDYLTLTN